MKRRFVTCIILIVFIIAAGVGLHVKASHKDSDTKEVDLNNFVVGLMSDELLNVQLERMEKNLGLSNIIIAAKCKDTLKSKSNLTFQKVTIEHVFKGKGLRAGDSIEIMRNPSYICMDESSYIDGMPMVELGYVNEMIPGKTYLIFLDKKMKTGNTITYLQRNYFFISPILCYDNTIKNTPIASIDKDGNFARYEDIKDNEFF